MNRATKPLAERFWEKVLVAGPNDCWLWLATKSRGYGQFWLSHRHAELAHRVSWFLTYGVWPELNVLHNCPNGDNPACCNPAHLWVGTHAENSADMLAKGREAKGEKNGLAKLVEADIPYIRERCRTGKRGVMTELATELSVTRALIGYVARGKIWKHVGGPIKGVDYV